MARKREVETELARAKKDLKAAEAIIDGLVKQRDKADQVAGRAKAALEVNKPPFSVARLLEFEIGARKAAEEYEPGPNSDAVKSALTNAAHGIAHVRKTLKTLGQVNQVREVQ